MSNEVQHGKKITIESYFDGELTKKQDGYEINLFSTKETILRDIIEALSVITSGETTKLTIEVQVDKQGRYRLVKQWRTI